MGKQRFLKPGTPAFERAFLKAGLVPPTGFKLPIPIVDQPNTKILRRIARKPESFDMGDWAARTECGTTFCRAGHIVALAGVAGARLARHLGYERAGKLIYAASRPADPLPDFYTYNDDAIADILQSAKREQAALRGDGHAKR